MNRNYASKISRFSFTRGGELLFVEVGGTPYRTETSNFRGIVTEILIYNFFVDYLLAKWSRKCSNTFHFCYDRLLARFEPYLAHSPPPVGILFYDNSRSCGLWPQQIMCSLCTMGQIGLKSSQKSVVSKMECIRTFSWPFG